MTQLRTLRSGALLLSALVLGACGDDGADATAAGSAGAGGTVATAGAAGAANVKVIALNDAQIASVALAANEGEVEQNTVAITRARSADVRSFAQDMVDMHSAARQREMTLAASTKITPADNQITQTLQAMSQGIVANLQASDEGEFDAMFMNGQVDVHTQVLALINDTLLPQVESAPLRDELTSMKSTVTEHLERARQLAASVGASDSQL